MPRVKKKEEVMSPPEQSLTLTAGRSRRTIKPNRKYLNDSVVLATTSKGSSRSSSADSDATEDEYKQEEDEEEEVLHRPGPGRKSGPVSAKKLAPAVTPRPRGRPPKHLKTTAKTEPPKNLRKEVMKKMDLSMLNLGKARVLLTPINSRDIKRKLDLDDSLGRENKPKQPEKPKQREVERAKLSIPLIKPKDADRIIKTIQVKAKDHSESSKHGFRVIRKKQEESVVKQDKNAFEKVINPVAVKRQLVEKSILDKRTKKVEESTMHSDGGEEDDVEIVGISQETSPNLARKAVRKSPLEIKRVGIKPTVVKVAPSMTVTGVKRKPVEALGEEDRPAKMIKKARPPPVLTTKARPPLYSDYGGETETESDIDTDSDSEPVRRPTRSRLASDKSSPSLSGSQNTNSAGKSKETAAMTGVKILKQVESNLAKSVSLPTLDKTKPNIRVFGQKPVLLQTPASKSLQMSKPMAQSTPKLGVLSATEKKSKSELNLIDPIKFPLQDQKASDLGKAKQATIRIVDIGDIIKKKSASTSDVRKAGMNRTESEDEDSDISEDSTDSGTARQKSNSAEKPKTNNQLVASILERKRPANMDHLRSSRPASKRGRPAIVSTKATSAEKPARQSVINLTGEDEIDFEDMLQTNIVTANKVQKIIQPNLMKDRRSGNTSSDENSGKTPPSVGTRILSANRGSALASSNNNNVYKSNNNGRFGSTGSLSRSGSTSPQKNPPRILNSTMKLGDNRPFAKLVSNSGNKHYSIDLTDPDNNNVKLIASPDSPPHSPSKRTLTKPVSRTMGPTGLRNSSNTVNKPVGGAVQRSLSSLTNASGGSPKMKKITCYETWYVINIPNNENKPERPSFAMSMIGLGNEAANIQLPSKEWSHKIILTKRKIAPCENDEVFCGEVEDRAISEEEKRNYEPCNIMFRRRTATPGKFNLQYDRAVIFKNDTFFINVDGKNCQLVGAPSKLDDTTDIETLLSVVDFVNLKNACVELSTA